MPHDTLQGARQGSTEPWRERLPMPAPSDMNPAQREAADALIAGPRKGVYGPFLPLLRSPQLLDRVAKVGEYLRFESVLDARIREFATCVAARHVTNQFEWLMHAPLAVKAGVPESAIEALRAGARPKGLAADEEAALDFATELLHTHGTSEPTYNAALGAFGEQGVVELATLVGYFVMVSWLMNVAHTPAQATAQGAPLQAFPL
ncbi:carboxymuconolactone decarboxylase family protein [Ramlibacter sp. WS9]|uniref:carboxymuconolactone decarboxylase family protein n=1 Tax=Ramlibacter sp. WS9 TaxID=1882741 RepID=UPI001143BF7A|nr:carboxymuconolactone decarboxylase family protein [Ramlibacter sp. WS9]ROZ62942.1 carboxymuconolactone decarboxylase family protein [Ramlibacter sp. WS9]